MCIEIRMNQLTTFVGHIAGFIGYVTSACYEPSAAPMSRRSLRAQRDLRLGRTKVPGGHEGRRARGREEAAISLRTGSRVPSCLLALLPSNAKDLR